MPAQPPALFLMGPTASGKTRLAIALARALPVELISVDSALVYRDMNIGTAKPSAAEQALAPHHLIDILSPLESYSAAQFVADARALMDDIHARGRIPLLVGGTMLYFHALCHGLSNLPASDATLRAQLDAEALARGWPALHAELAQVDPITAARLAPHDAQRIQRALEVYRLSGQALSHWHQEEARHALPYPVLKLALLPAERAVLHARIATRFDSMLAAGFLDEVQCLRERYPTLAPDCTAMRCVGYRQAWSYLDGEVDYATFVAQGVAATRQLAKRQLTWMRGMDDLQLFDCLNPCIEQAILAAVHAFIAT